MSKATNRLWLVEHGDHYDNRSYFAVFDSEIEAKAAAYTLQTGNTSAWVEAIPYYLEGQHEAALEDASRDD